MNHSQNTAQWYEYNYPSVDMDILIAYVSITILKFAEATILLQNTPECGQVAALYHKLCTILLDYTFY